MIIALMLPNLTKLGVLIDFKINQDFIAAVLCINKEEPMLTCSGKCYLSDQLKKVEDQEEKQAPSPKKERFEISYYYLSHSPYCLRLADCYLSKLKSDRKQESYSSSFITDIFRPPKFNLI